MAKRIPPTDPAVLAYTAGLMDGEGCISIVKVARHGRREWIGHKLQVILAGTHEPTIRWLGETFGGSVSAYESKRPGRKRIYQWVLAEAKAEAFLRSIRPYLITKAAQADLAFELRKTILRGNATPRPRVTPELLAERERLRGQMRSLNARGAAIG